MAGPEGPAGAGVSRYRKTLDQALTLTTQVALLDLAFPIAANASVEIEGMILLRSAATTTGFQLGWTGPAIGTGFAHLTEEYQSSATAWTSATLNAFGNFTLVTAVYVAATIIQVRLKGVVVNGANAGTVQMTGATEVAASAVTILRGSFLKVG